MPTPPSCTTDKNEPAGATGTEKKKVKKKKETILIEKVTLDMPQKTYLFKVYQQDCFLLAFSDNLEPYKRAEREEDEELYRLIKRSHDHWLDIRDKKNFMHSPQREKDVHSIAERNNLSLIDFK